MRRLAGILCLCAGGWAAAWPSMALARIKLITLPVRERVEIQLDNPDATLVEEERIVPLVKGVNQVDFSWANTQIDPNTIVFRVLGPAGKDALPNKAATTNQPIGRSDRREGPLGQLSAERSGTVWTVGCERFRLGAGADQLPAGQPQQELQLPGRRLARRDRRSCCPQYMRLQNFANESFGSTRAVGRLRSSVSRSRSASTRPKKCSSASTRSADQKTYTCNPQEFDYLDRAQNKLRVPMHYVLKNDQAHQLGEAALPFGKVRIFQEGRPTGSTAFLGEDWGKFTPQRRRDAALSGRGPGHRRQAHHRQERSPSGSPATCTTTT